MAAVTENENWVLTFDARRVRRIGWVARNAIVVVTSGFRGEQQMERVTADPFTLQWIIKKLQTANSSIAIDSAPVPPPTNNRWRAGDSVA